MSVVEIKSTGKQTDTLYFIRSLDIDNDKAVKNLSDSGYKTKKELLEVPPSKEDLDNFGFSVFERNKIIKVLSDSQEPKSKKLKLKFAPIQIKRPNLSDNFIDVEDLHYAGITSEKSCRFYARKETGKLLKFLATNECVLVEGPPGVGKSQTVWIWAREQSFSNSITWLHIDETKIHRCTFKHGQIIDFHVMKTESDVINEIINCETDILIVDGIATSASANISDILRPSFSWKSNFLESHDHRKLILVSSLQIQIKLENEEFLNLKRYFMLSWELAEYQEAFKDAIFSKSRSKFLSGEDDIDIDEKILNKYYLAGGSARWMLGCSVTAVEIDAKKHVDKSLDFQKLLAGLTGNRSEFAVNHLLQYLQNESSVFLVSEYVTRLLTEKCELEFVKMASRCPLSKNPSFDGWILEADFLLQVRLAEEKSIPIKLLDYQKIQQTVNSIVWLCSDRISFFNPEDLIKLVSIDPLLTSRRLISNKTHTWFLPLRWNQGCYDAIQLVTTDDQNIVRFIQITRANTHSVKFKYINSILDVLGTIGFQVKSVQLAFILPTDSSPVDFKVNRDTDSLLTKYKQLWDDNGYEKGQYFLYGFDRTH